MLYAFNKPFGVLCQFSGEGDTLANYINIKKIYPAGRLDKDSEGLLLLTDDGKLQHKISNPKFDKQKTYVVQVDRQITTNAITQLCRGVTLKDGLTKPAEAIIIDEPNWLWDRNPPVRFRKDIPTSWIKLIITEGKNRQVRRMTAQVGFPTLRLIRTQIGDWKLDNIDIGKYESF
ncbi:LSU rRNA pseudouridine(2457) synthase (EC 5.4.99.20) [uncultured Gammaproteobacteria bacterium]|nr:LSU rRNA pseudouridine(2457) synthase (EC 5.4.99.20) [uncultured Gammaproteobacteria bacterium]CAC9954454.1 LSU rRNA pseudouridine(2457) synthase (EC 5.4.99.20) [uncultured Gammaproteobacteria bacterium]CAC9954730.1 LSU rRNA pseudouridine(2457) synthase (EC 5.4.99.20) [uncultured Gammaproteobacteria bacterium]